MKALYEVRDYKQFIRAELDSARFGRGARMKLAEFLGVQASFISLVLTGKQEFAPEHGIKIASFLELSPAETNFFLLLIQRDRAGSVELRKHFQGLIDRTLAERSEIQNRVKTEGRKVSSEDLNEYYGAWFHIAVHMSIRNPKRRDVDSIAAALGVKRSDVKGSLELLEKIGFIQRVKGEYTIVGQRFHAGEKTPALRAHLTNWRQSAIRALDERDPEDLHYSAVMSIDKKAFAEVKRVLLETIEKMDPLIREADDRDVVALNFDFFRVTESS
jgi:uncharacterized protein (TIGR02147 family)